MRGPVRLVRGWLASLRRRAMARRLAASGLVDPGYYRAAYTFLAPEVDPALHYVKRGAADGLNPHPMFDTCWYVDQNPEVRQRGLNPLYHFLVEGAARRRRPHPHFSAQQLLEATCGRAGAIGAASLTQEAPLRPAERATAAPRASAPFRYRVRPLGLETVPAGPPALGRPLTVLVSHVLPFPPRAGNEYRIHRLLRWLERAGHEVLLVLAPTPGWCPSDAQLAELATAHPNLVVCAHDGQVVHRVGDPTLRAALEALDGTDLPAEAGRGEREELLPETAALERAFCPDHLLHLLDRMAAARRPAVFVASYVFNSRALLRQGQRVIKVIDTHDVFSTKKQKVERFGVRDGLALSPGAEATMVERADLVVAIQPLEARELAALAPSVEVVTAGVDFDVASVAPPPARPVVLYVASNNPMNAAGLRDFLWLAWPIIRRERPDATLHVVGPVCETVLPGWEGVELLGRVDLLAPAYAAARLVINPAVAGTGLKIKTLEALANLRPIVSWPSGTDGLSPAAAARCHVARDWYQFARLVLELLTTGGAERLFEARPELELELGAEAVYAELGAAIERRLRLAEGGAAT